MKQLRSPHQRQICAIWRAALGASFVLSAVAGSSAHAQDDSPTPPEDPARSIDDIRRDLERDDPVGQAEELGPMPESMEFDPLMPPKGRLKPEGSFLIGQTGYLTWSDTLKVTHFVMETAETNPRRMPEPMVLLPCRTTQRIEERVAREGSIGPVRLSGRVYVHDKRNYIVPSSMPFRTSTPVAPLNEGLRLEGTYLANRAARISRSDSGGQWIVTFDADSSGMQDPPMILVPCRLLERIIRMAKMEGDAASAVISGQVYTYHDSNYLLPTVFVRPHKSTNLSP